jgi:hypothetical protein
MGCCVTRTHDNTFYRENKSKIIKISKKKKSFSLLKKRSSFVEKRRNCVLDTSNLIYGKRVSMMDPIVNMSYHSDDEVLRTDYNILEEKYEAPTKKGNINLKASS